MPFQWCNDVDRCSGQPHTAGNKLHGERLACARGTEDRHVGIFVDACIEVVKADVNAYLDKLRRDAANEPDAAVRKRHMSYIRFVKRLGSRDAVSRRFFVIFQYEAPTNERNISYAEIVSTLETTARNFRTYLAQCGNAIVEHENEDEFLTDVFYTLLNRRTAVQISLQERIQDVLASYLAQNDATALDKIPPAAFMIPPSLDLKHGRYLCIDGTYHAYLMIPADGYRAQVTAGWMALLVNAGEGIDVDLFLERQPKERMMQKIGQQIRINRSKIKDTSDTNSDFDDLSNAIRSGYYLKDGLANNEDFYYAAILVTVTAASVKDLEWRIGEIRKLMVSQDMNLQLCSFRQEAAFLSSLLLCSPDAALFKKYRRNILTSTAASFYPFVSFELCDTNGVLLGVNKYNNSLVSLAGEGLKLQPHRADFQKAGERVDDAALLPRGAQQKVDGLDFQNFDVAVICGVQDAVLNFLDGEQVIERLPFYQLSVAVCLALQNLCIVGQGVGIVVVDNAIPLADEPQVPVSVGFKIALRCGCDDTAALHKAEPVCYKLRQAVTADADHTENTQRYRHRNDNHQTDIERQRQIKQRHCAAHGKHSRLHRIAQLDCTAEDRTGVHKILRNQVNIPLLA